MLLKVSSKTEPKKLAGAILGAMRENGGSVELQAIGAGAVNQAVKAVAVAHRIMDEDDGRKIKVIPGFADVELRDRQVTAVKFTVFAS
ncbi:MAG: Stage V sporulation protein S [Pelotomaculum sp. PtaB.Bin104]|nr:MAG: Stage V sporulation protein S [Pelotomaculum sp. PtaB.Bin104]